MKKPKAKKRGQPRKPDSEKRVPLSCRVAPETMAELKAMDGYSLGKAVDHVVTAWRFAAILLTGD